MSKTAKKSVTGRLPVESVEVLVIGAGISGIGAAIRLLGEGIRDFAVLEKHERLGGTWRDNTYPGCACDVPSALYSYSFAQKPDWSRVFAGQAEILDYVEATAREFGVLPYLRFGEAVQESHWNDRDHCWEVRTGRTQWRARAVISCTGYLHEPVLPALPGLAEFSGTVFHSSRWRHDHDLRGERIAVIGTGASAIQFVPEIQKVAGRLEVYQRTPQWILPKPDAALPALAQGALGLPLAAPALRALIYGGFEVFGIGFRQPAWLKQLEKVARLHLRQQVADPVLRAKLTPDYTLGCKRVLLSNHYYPALTAPNVELHATGVRGFRGNTVIGQDGSEREVDTVIFGTGFEVADQPIARHVYGRDGRSMAEVWAGSPEAYRGSTVHGFPNLFLVLGPNLAIGHNSAFIVIEAQLDYAMAGLRALRTRGLARLEVRADAQAAYNARVQHDLAGTVWNTGGCSSYYLDRNGRNSIGFPWSTLTMRRLLADFDLRHYDALPADAGVNLSNEEPAHA